MDKYGFAKMTDAELDAIADARMDSMSDDELGHFYDEYHNRGRIDVLFDPESSTEFYGVSDLEVISVNKPVYTVAVSEALDAALAERAAARHSTVGDIIVDALAAYLVPA